MKRTLRILILGPILLAAMLAFFLALPLARLIDWLFDIPDEPLRATYRDIYRETVGSLW